MNEGDRVSRRGLQRRYGGARCHATVGEPSSYFALTATPHAVTSTGGNGIVFRDGQTELGKSVGGAGLVLGCATLPKAVICVQQVSGDLGNLASGFALTEICHGQSRGYLTSLRPSMIPASTRLCARIIPKREIRLVRFAR